MPTTHSPTTMDDLLNNTMSIPSNCLMNVEETVEEFGCIRGGTQEFMDKFDMIKDPKFYCDGVLVSIIGLTGLIGNLLALIVLSRPKLRDVFHQLLFALASFDLMYIIVGGINYTFKAFEANSDVFVYLYPHVIHPFTQITVTGTIFMTVAITIERYLGLCHPFLPPQSRKAWFYVVPVTIISVAMNIPKFLEVEHNWDELKDTEGNITSVISYRSTKLRYQEDYIRGYIMWTRLFSDGIIPVAILLYLNTRIILALVSATKVQRFNSSRRQRKEINLSILLLCIVVIFFCGHAARIILDLYEFWNIERVYKCADLRKCTLLPFTYLPNNFFYVLPVISHLMMILNSSTNFIVYCLVGHNFRRELCETFCKSRYIPIPSTLRSMVLTYDHSTAGNQDITSRKGSPNENKEKKNNVIAANNQLSSTPVTSPIGPYKKDSSSSTKSGYENKSAKKLNGINGCNGHKNILNITEYNNFPNETETSFSMTMTSTSTVLNVKGDQSKQV